MMTSVPDHLPNSTRSPTLNIKGENLAGFVRRTWADGQYLAFDGLLLGGIGDDDAGGGPFLDLHPLKQDAITEGPKMMRHRMLLHVVGVTCGCRTVWFRRSETPAAC
jgi:hypothetical protein